MGCFANMEWSQIEGVIKKRMKDNGRHRLPFVYAGEPGLDIFLSDIAGSQRCTWHASKGPYYALWRDNLKKKDSRPHTDKIRELIGIELPEGEYELLKEQDKEQVRAQCYSSKAEIQRLIQTFKDKRYQHGVSYLESLAGRLFANIELWLQTGVIAPKKTSLLERVFREIGRRLKRIAWGWSDEAVTKLSKMIMLKQYSRSKWEQF